MFVLDNSFKELYERMQFTQGNVGGCRRSSPGFLMLFRTSRCKIRTPSSRNRM